MELLVELKCRVLINLQGILVRAGGYLIDRFLKFSDFVLEGHLLLSKKSVSLFQIHDRVLSADQEDSREVSSSTCLRRSWFSARSRLTSALSSFMVLGIW